MCLMAFYWDPDATEDRRALILAANRDEYYERPSAAAHFWKDMPHIYGGRDLLGGGSWLAVSTKGRLAAVTNFFSPPSTAKNPRSRGEIVSSFVNGDDQNMTAIDFACKYIEPHRDEYNGFSAVLFDGKSLVYCCNRSPDGSFAQELSKGCYGLSNNFLDTSWPKLEKVKQALLTKATEGYDETAATATSRSKIMSHQEIAKMLLEEFEDETLVSDKSLLPTILSEEEEHWRSAIFVKSPEFGTRSTTIVTFQLSPPKNNNDKNTDTGCNNRGGFFEMTEKIHQTPCVAISSVSHQKILLE